MSKDWSRDAPEPYQAGAADMRAMASDVCQRWAGDSLGDDCCNEVATAIWDEINALGGETLIDRVDDALHSLGVSLGMDAHASKITADDIQKHVMWLEERAARRV